MTYDEFLTHVLPSVGGCPDQLALDHVLKAARTFCARTLVWNYAPPAIVVDVGQANYTLQIPEDQELVRLLFVEVGGTQYAVPDGPAGRRAARQARGHFCSMQGLRDFTLTPVPSIAGAEIITDLAVKPSMTSTAWPDDFAEYVSDIAAGAIATLCLLPRVEWTDAVLAQTQMTIFNARIGTIGMKVSKGLGNTRTSSRVAWF